jgi:hypothetical protein
MLVLKYGFVDALRDSPLIKVVKSLYDHRRGTTEVSIIPKNYDEETLEDIDCLFSELLCKYENELEGQRIEYLIK